ncbi:MAG: hypothetical protein PHY93_08830 [Bacteriovorax sp.]|nr:hypothetical protein [Bacteriovorax sp.]
MKVILILTLSLFSFSTFAHVDSSKCPEKFSITYYDINRGPLTKKIEVDPFLKAGWDGVKQAQKFEQEFHLSTKSDTDLCVYINKNGAVILQTNDGVDELRVPYSNNLYFRTKVLSFSNDYIELAVDEESKNIYAPILQPNSDGGVNVIGEVEVGEAEAVNIEVLD